jgi:outer membrane protein OmpA-like peptidoglycan-associated protein
VQPEQPAPDAAGNPAKSDVYADTLPVQQRVCQEMQPPPPPQPTHPGSTRRPRAWTLGVAALLILAAVIGAAAVTAHPGRHHTTAAPAAPAPTRAPSPAPSPSRSRSQSPSPSAPPAVQLRATLQFPGDSANLDAACQASITALGAQIRRYGHGQVDVNGYTATDGTGGQDELRLSLARAEAVAALLRQTLAGTPITVAAHGFGAANPVAPNGGEAGRARNRRVDIVFTAAA